MSLELVANNAQTTTTGSIDGATDPVAFTVTDPSLFPSSGNFRVLIDSEILIVTGVASSTFTASRAAEGTSIASHTSGATVTQVLTRGGLRQLVGEYNLGGAIADRPAAGTVGRVFYPSDGGPIYRDTGSAWQAWVNNFGPFTPPAGQFSTWVNQSSATYSETDGYGKLLWPGANSGGEFCSMVLQSLGSPPWTFTGVFAEVKAPGSNGNFGIVTRDTAGGKLTTHSVRSANIITSGYKFNSPTSYNSAFHSDVLENTGPLYMFRLKNDGVTWSWQHSYDFRNWIENRSVVIASAWHVPDQIGFYINPQNQRSNQTGGILVYHASLTA